jgi:tRNA threonylcarbamoyladenosine biosynthesis protein TsaE
MKLPTTSLELSSGNPEETRRLADTIGRRLQGGSLLLLKGDLGSGKTVFAQGLATGLAVPDEYTVTSPTYTLVHEYPGRLPFFHVDLYRLPAGGADMESLGLADQTSASGVVLIEWPDRLPPGELPPEHLTISLVPDAPQARKIRLIAYGQPYVDLINMLDFSKD